VPATELTAESPARERMDWYKLWEEHIEEMPVGVWRRLKVDCDIRYARLRLGYVARAKGRNKMFTTRIEDDKLFVMMKGDDKDVPRKRKR
jgi:hypothetical protein